jgi:threonine/homoserine/homoserine lactone efflux protein
MELSPICIASGGFGFLERFFDMFRGLPPNVLAGLLGFISGFVISIPVGPVNLTIVNEGARCGFKKAALISFGATLMETLYCAIAFTGFAVYFGNPTVKKSMEVFSFAFLMFLGIKFLVAKTVTSTTHFSEATDKLGARIEEKFRAHSAFMLGFVRVMGNPGVLVFWIIIAQNFISRDWVTPDWPGKLSFVMGMGLGTGLWFFGLSYAASLGYGKFSDKTMLRIERFSGVCLIAMAFIHGGNLVWELMQHKH